MRYLLYGVCWILERLCRLTHPFAEIEIKLTGSYCNVCNLAVWIDEKFNVGFWK